MNFSLLFRLLSVGLLVQLGLARGQAPDSTSFFIHDGDKPIVFLGDSITQQQRYTTLIETYVLTRFPAWQVTFRNVGWGGDTSWLPKRGDFDKGLQRDVLSLHPKVVVIDYGMNDASNGMRVYPLFMSSMTKLVDRSKQVGARVALVTSSPCEGYEAGQPAGSKENLVIQQFCQGLKEIADREHVPFIDQFDPFLKVIEAGRAAGVLSTTSPPATYLIPGGVHPSWGGHLVMATAILQGMHAPSLVSTASLDAGTHSTVSADHCTINWQQAPTGVVQFERTDEALPWPIPPDPTIEWVLKIPGFDPGTALSEYGLKVAGLTAALYSLTIDGIKVGTFSGSDLASGINLGLMKSGPIYDQEQKLLQAVISKNGLFDQRWRVIQLGSLPVFQKTAEENRLDGAIADAERGIDSLRMPTSHIFKLEPTS